MNLDALNPKILVRPTLDGARLYGKGFYFVERGNSSMFYLRKLGNPDKAFWDSKYFWEVVEAKAK